MKGQYCASVLGQGILSRSVYRQIICGIYRKMSRTVQYMVVGLNKGRHEEEKYRSVYT